MISPIGGVVAAVHYLPVRGGSVDHHPVADYDTDMPDPRSRIVGIENQVSALQIIERNLFPCGVL